jgi:hypothetical protein
MLGMISMRHGAWLFRHVGVSWLWPWLAVHYWLMDIESMDHHSIVAPTTPAGAVSIKSPAHHAAHTTQQRIVRVEHQLSPPPPPPPVRLAAQALYSSSLTP